MSPAIANVYEGPTYELKVGHIDGMWRDLGRQVGTLTAGMRRIEVAADRFSTPAHDHGADEEIFFVLGGEQGAPTHCHSAEEEIFVMIEGDGVLELWGRGTSAPDEHPLRAGDVVSRVAGTGVAHALRAGEDGLTYLAYGTSEPGDMCFYPQSGRVSIRGLGIALRSPEIDFLPEL